MSESSAALPTAVKATDVAVKSLEAVVNFMDIQAQSLGENTFLRSTLSPGFRFFR
jgi:hypothetical protein